MTGSGRARHTLNRRRPPPGPASGRPDDRLRRTIQYSRDIADGTEEPQRTGYPHARGMTTLVSLRVRHRPWGRPCWMKRYGGKIIRGCSDFLTWWQRRSPDEAKRHAGLNVTP